MIADALKRREEAAKAMENAAAVLDTALADFQASTADIRAGIIERMQQAATAAHARAAADCASRGPPGTTLEANQRGHVAESAKRSASAEIERRFNSALELMFVRGSAAETFSFELSRQVLRFISEASGDAQGTDANRPPAGRFAEIVRAQCAKLRELN